PARHRALPSSGTQRTPPGQAPATGQGPRCAAIFQWFRRSRAGMLASPPPDPDRSRPGASRRCHETSSGNPMPHPTEAPRMHDTLLLFGATGDLAQRYLFPSLLRLQGDGLLPENFRVRAMALSPHDTEKFRGIVRERLGKLSGYTPTPEQIESFLQRIDYRSVDMRTPASVADAVRDMVDRPCVSYLSIPPSLYITTCEGLALGGAFAAPHRLMLEKPIGHDLDSARQINQTIGRLIDEDRIFRIDHYLGKAAVQNLIALRFGNTLLEAVWNRD